MHSPAPWTVQHDGFHSHPAVKCSDGPLATCCGTAPGFGRYSEQGNSRRLSDAHLIAAAPDMLEALRQMVVNAEADGKTYRDCYEKAVAAIAKAEGRS